MGDNSKRDLRTQFGALCYRVVGGKTQILLITSRTRKRWILPKGWPMDGESPTHAAETEAWEEAGAKGKIKPVCIGIYGYRKQFDGEEMPCMVAIFPLKVKSLASDFPERDERRRKWFSLAKAAKKVDEPELRHLISRFDPSTL
ncbi:NUDIX hydrolase [Alphaproteobacteria bacterium KMM 3653]|uniref:NUDIX hydrolase n=2 Tax=Harenicola maris TaxID=2841044 RepID=A0AAP2G2P4_9RHOB|nr:NUDIX hydrolase [Harenicola maris]